MCDALGAKIVDRLSVDDLKMIGEVEKANAEPHELVEMIKGDTHI